MVARMIFMSAGSDIGQAKKIVCNFFATSQSFSFTFHNSFQIMCFPQKLSLFILFSGAALASSTPTDDSKPPILNKYSSPLLDSFRPSPSSRSFHPAASPLDRTIDLSSLGIDLGDIFDRLLSPAGIVQQFVLTLTLGRLLVHNLCFAKS